MGGVQSQEPRPEVIVGAGAAGIAILLLALGLYVVKPSLHSYRELAAERARALLELDAQASDADRLEIAALVEEVAELRSDLYGSSSSVPPQQMESYVIDALDQISGRHEVTLTSVTPGRPGDVLMFGELPFDVEVAGRYFYLFEWFQDVERELRPMVVQEFEMRRGGADNPVTMKLRLVAYRSQGAEL